MAVVAAYPRPTNFKDEIIEAFYQGIKHKPDTTFGNVKADVLADKDSSFQQIQVTTDAVRTSPMPNSSMKNFV